MLTGHSANVASILSLPGPQFLEGRAPDATLEGAAEKNALPLKMLSWKVTRWDQAGARISSEDTARSSSHSPVPCTSWVVRKPREPIRETGLAGEARK